MPFNNLISRVDAAALIPAEESNEIISAVTRANPVLQLAKRLPPMSTATRTMPVTSALALAYFVNGDTGLKQTTELNWAGVNLVAEELAVIVPIPEAVLADSNHDIWGEVKPQLVEAFNIAIANAIFWGANIPASWTVALGAAGLLARCTAAGHTLSFAGNGYADLYEAIMAQTPGGVAGLLMTLEADGFMATGHIASTTMRGRLRGVRDINGQPIFTPSMVDKTRYQLDGEPVYFPTDGTVPDATAWDIAGQWDQLVYSFRQDISYKLLDQAVIQDGAGAIVYNLAQQDMVALRAVMRLGVALPNPINRMNANAATRCQFAILTA